MSETKVTVKDLSAELNVAPKDVMQALRQLGVPAKSSSSPVPGESVDKVRAHFKSPDEVSRKEVGAVIVRRRKRSEDAPEGEAPAAVTESAEAAPAASTTPAAPAEKDTAPAAAPVAASAEAPAAAPETDKAEKKAKVIRRPQDVEDRPARIITPAQAEKPAPSAAPEVKTEVKAQAPAAVSTPEVKSEAKAEAPAQASAQAPAQATPVAQAATEAVAEKKPEAPAKTRIATPDASAMPEGSSAPTLPQRAPERTRPEGMEMDDEDDADGRRGRRRGGDRDTDGDRPATPQVRIISRPSPEAVQRAADSRNAPRPAGGRPAGGYGDNRGPRPGGGAPGGDRGPRPGGGFGDNRGPRPGGGAPGGDRGPRPGGGFGGPRPGGPGGAPGGSPDPNAASEQSKKKRMKGRRTVDFQGGGGDFGRRGGDEENTSRLGRSSKGRRKGKDARSVSTATQPLKAAKRKIRVTEAIRVSDMAHQMGLKSNEIIKVLFGLGVMATINQSLDIETATLVAAEFDYEVEKAGFSEDDYLIPTEADTPEDMRPRPPVVTIMGHVDHGKTSLLDAIRKSNVTSGEAGGITQHIGAYHVRTKRGEIVFLDTPGHEAFTAMRARGAQVTDLVILVVAADDGVMEQTREAINHSKAAGVPIMVAVNKMDKPGADPDRVLRELAELGLQAESWGGDTVTAMVSAKSRQGLDELLELVALQAEILELKANPVKAARGRIVEAKLDKGRGPVATVLIQEGTLHQGDTFVCGVFSGRVRALFSDQGKKVKEAGPSIPVEVQGFDGVPEAGEEFVCVTDEKLARRIADTRAIKQRERDLAKESKVTLETFLARSPTDQEALTLNLVLKADVQGSLEAITEALLKQSTEKVRINVVHGGAGAISESDILLASASQAIIIGFNVRPTAKIKDIAEQENVDIRFYDIIYKLVDDIKGAMTGMLAPVQREQYLGQAEVRDTFSVPKVGVIAGCHVSDGKMSRNAGVRLLRDGVVVYTGKISSLKRFKDDAKEVLKGYECGIGLENYNDIKQGDIIEAFEMVEEAATL